jgi:hypothetical protein
MKTIEVKNTQPYKDPQKGEFTVCEGKLLLMYTSSAPVENHLTWNKINGYFIWTKEHVAVNKGLAEYRNCCLIAPIIISQSEKIKIGDAYLHNLKEIKSATTESDYPSPYSRKVLAFAENLTPKHIKAIADGKLQPGQEVLVECEFGITPGEIVNHKDGFVSTNKGKPYYKIRLTKDNHVKLFPAKLELDQKLYQLENEFLKVIANVPIIRKVTNLNNQGFSGIERDLAKSLVEEVKKTFKEKA